MNKKNIWSLIRSIYKNWVHIANLAQTCKTIWSNYPISRDIKTSKIAKLTGHSKESTQLAYIFKEMAKISA